MSIAILAKVFLFQAMHQPPMHPGPMSDELIQRMMSLLKSSMEQPGMKKRGLWKFCEPSIVKAAWVYGQSAHAHQVQPVDVGESPDSSWYPCLVAYDTLDPGYQNVLCKPLLENGCKRPFRTHESRLVYINSHAPQPQHFEHSTVTIEEVIEPQPENCERPTVTIEEVIEDTVIMEEVEVMTEDAWRNYRWEWWKTCPDWARVVEELHDHEDEEGLP